MAANIYRSSAGDVHTAGSVVYNNTFGQETMSMTSSHGNDITFSGQAASWFNPNNLQIKTNGNSFSDTQGHRSTYTKRDHYLTTGGTLTISTGTPRLFDKDDTTISDYVKIRGELAAAQCSPYTQQGGKTNNSGATFEMKGSVDPESGSTEGKSFPPNPARENYDAFVKSKASEMLKLEQKMGEGGDLVLAAGKDVTFSAGTKAIAIDSGYINPVGAKIVKGYKIDGSQDKGKRAVPEYTSAPSYQEKDTFSNIPFGTLNLAGANRVMVKAGAGGFNVEGAGSIKLTGTGLSWLGGAQVNLVSTGTTFMNSAALIATTNNFNVQSPESQFTGNVHVQQNVIIGANTEIGGDLTVYGDVLVHGKLHVMGPITTDAHVFAETNVATAGDINAFSGEGGGSGLSFRDHVHPQNNGNDTGGGVNTNPPVR
jgi:hypothetical protein